MILCDGEVPMFAEERRREIMKLIEKSGSVTVKEISEILNVSPSTVRNDLKHLEKEGLIFRTHGGAMAKHRFDPMYEKRRSSFSELKMRIAKKAVEFVEEGDVIFVDSGSTTLMFVEELIRNQIRCNVITNSLYVINALVDVPHIPVHVIGGEFRKRTMNFIDPEFTLDKYRIKKAFMGISGFDAEGTYVSNLVEARFKRMIMDISKEVFVLADSSKYEKISAILIRKWKEKDVLITDKKLFVKAKIIVSDG